ncbi:YeeE/YedE thiosulfate transporter family protein [Allopontixanthobacter sp.]|uniref:YeeE/YedE thiosulfate transporter family protein n=1 Tax=Allopontixanthobacter sp. TaxID=2906452 RepID=UPI002ABA38FE|nr:YeeE/YedE thiosulfate transporter family protein [Allopontixanthobacter sp.]MDZ4307024.1 YeeE/YedE thiosulfate transporter family protein [Allopontixanthobacter sp.]
MTQLAVWITPLAGFLLGAALVRANSCTVASTRRLVIERRPDWMLGLLIAISWAGMVLLGMAFLSPQDLRFPADLPITMPIVGGSVLLGAGALLNRGCFLGSVSQLCRGNLNYLLTLAGIALALALFVDPVADSAPVSGRFAADAIDTVRLTWSGCLTALLFAVLILFSLAKLRKRRTTPLVALVTVGICGGVIYALNPDWSYTSVLDRAVNGNLTASSLPLEIGAISMFAGAILSSALGSGFSLVLPSIPASATCLGGGFLMASGARLIPGGNDTMMLWSIPGLTSYGIVAYAIMILTIAAGLYLLRWGESKQRWFLRGQDA